MRQGMRDAEADVVESHGRHTRCVVHVRACVHVVAIGEAANQIRKDQLDGLLGERVGEVAGQPRHIGLHRVGEDVHAGIGGHLRWQGGDEYRIDDGDVSHVLS